MSFALIYGLLEQFASAMWIDKNENLFFVNIINFC